MDPFHESNRIAIFLKKLKPRHGLALLIDDWQDSEDVFLEARRLKDLFFFYEEEPEEIKQIYLKASQSSDEAEVQSEALFQLGLITFLDALRSQTLTCLNLLQESLGYFFDSSHCIENRVDADFFYITVSILIGSLNGDKGGIRDQLESLSEILWKREMFSFSGYPNRFFLGFYRALSSIGSVENLLSTNWLDYRDGFKKLHYYLCEIKNTELEQRLSESGLRHEFSSFLEKRIFEPYFAISRNAEISKVKERLIEVDEESDEFVFLKYLEEILESTPKKKLLLT